MCVLSERVGDVGRPPLMLGKGGGVNDNARGLLWLEGDGEMAGDDASGGTRQLGVSTGVSSSDSGLGSSSLSNDDTKGVALSTRVKPFLSGDVPLVGLDPDGPVTAVAVAAGDVAELDVSP